MDTKFSVLLSVYYKEKPEYLKAAIESIYFAQTIKPSEIILVEDGPLTEDLYKIIKILKNKIGQDILKSVKLQKNMGLGNALKEGILNCTYEYIFRMDTDDISYSTRFEKQLEYATKNKDVDVLGSYMSEFIDNIDNIICVKDVPLLKETNMKKYMKFRDPVNHPSVLLKKSKVLEAGNYKEIFLNEDSYLWARMLSRGCIFDNIPEELVYFRVNDDTYKRRGGWKYVKAEMILQKEYLKLGIISKIEFCLNVILKSIVRLIPNRMRKTLYLKIFRKRRLNEKNRNNNAL